MTLTRTGARLLFAGMMLAAALLRLTGVSWDERRHLHPDERFLSMFEEAIQFPKTIPGYFDTAHSPLNPFNRNFQPVYGTFPVFLAKAVSIVLLHKDGYDTTFLAGRVLSALFDLATIWITYLLARRFGRRGTALCAASLVAFCPLGIQLSHFWGADSFLTTFSALALLGSVRIARGRTSIVSLSGTGAAVGLAAACKVTGLALLGPAGFAVLASAIFTPVVRKPTVRALLIAAGRGLIVLAAAFVAVRVTFPYGFSGLFRPDPRWIRALQDLTNLTKGYGFPPQVQWAERTPLFPFRNLILWGAGIFFGIPAVIALLWAPIRAWKRRDDGIFLLWLHALIVFGYHATASTKNIRYFYPVYPALAVLAAVMLAALAERRRLARALPAIAVVGTLLFGVAFSSIYRRPVTRSVASRWMFENIRPPVRVANEDWDDGLPFPDPVYEVKDYAGPVLHMYNPDSRTKVEEIVSTLEGSDWIAITSNRAYGSVTRVPDVFPMTREYYRLLFSNQLGFVKAADFTSYPSLGPLRIPDDSAEETFTVYDHPRVLLFRRTKEFSPQRLRRMLLAALPAGATPPVMDEWARWPKARRRVEAPITPNGASSVSQALVRSGSSPAAGPMSDELVGSWPAAILFYLAALAMGVCAFPICFRLFTRLDDRGFGFARTAGLAAATYLLTIGVQKRVLTSGRSAAWTVALVLAAAGALTWWSRRHEIAAFLRGRRRSLVLSEGVFLLGFVLFAVLRAMNPEIFWGEKPMDFSILNILARTRTLPASDPWMAGAPLGYYTFGQEMIVFLSLLTGLSTRYTFNLAFGWIGGATLQGAFALVRDWTGSRRAGAISAAFVALFGNLAGLREWIINQPLDKGHGGTRHLDWHYFWATSRVTGGTTINEFPFWSLVFADLHSHVLAFPLFLLVFACALELVRAHADPIARGRRRLVAAATLGAAAAAHGLTNAWDIPFLIGLLVLVSVIAAFASGRLSARGIGRALLSLVVSAVTAAALFQPLWVRGGGSPGFGRNMSERAKGADIATVFGVFFFLVLAWWLVTVARRRGGSPAGGGRAGTLVLTLGGGLVLGVAAFRLPDLFLGLSLVLFLAAAFTFERSPEGRLACGLIATAFFLILFAQLFYIYDRQNTFFKLYLEAWFCFGIAGAVLVFGRRDRPGAFATWPIPLRAVFLVLVAAALFHTVVGGRGGVGLNRPSLPDGVRPGPMSLDGLAYLDRWHPGEARAVRWLRESVPGTPAILEAQGPGYQQFGRISMLTGLPTVLGWEYHVQQRGNPQSEIDARAQAVRAMYTNPGAEAIESLLHRYGVVYVYVGALERQTYPAAGLAKFDRAKDLFHVAYENPDVKIYRVAGGSSEDVVVTRRESLPTVPPAPGEAPAPDIEPEEAPAIAAQAVADVSPWEKMREPRDAAVDRKGRVWIADFGHSRLRLFDPRGGFLGGWGGKGDGQHGFRELCGVATHGDDVYVADTWNGRVERFGQDGTWKAAAKELYGPRGVAVGADGRVWVADTGNSRLMLYDENLAGGRPLGKKGTGAGELDNPIGIAIAPSGKVYVADVGNRRIQVLGLAGNFAATWPVPGWGSGIEPHVEVDGDENVWVTDPSGNALLEFGPDGRLRQRMTADLARQPFSHPTGLAVDRVQGVLYVVNSGSNKVSVIRLARGVPP